ncbi:unnamed protein product, partial [Cylindrotheca closterium]
NFVTSPDISSPRILVLRSTRIGTKKKNRVHPPAWCRGTSAAVLLEGKDKIIPRWEKGLLVLLKTKKKELTNDGATTEAEPPRKASMTQMSTCLKIGCPCRHLFPSRAPRIKLKD